MGAQNVDQGSWNAGLEWLGVLGIVGAGGFVVISGGTVAQCEYILEVGIVIRREGSETGPIRGGYICEAVEQIVNDNKDRQDKIRAPLGTGTTS